MALHRLSFKLRRTVRWLSALSLRYKTQNTRHKQSRVTPPPGCIWHYKAANQESFRDVLVLAQVTLICPQHPMQIKDNLGIDTNSLHSIPDSVAAIFWSDQIRQTNLKNLPTWKRFALFSHMTVCETFLNKHLFYIESTRKMHTTVIFTGKIGIY